MRIFWGCTLATIFFFLNVFVVHASVLRLDAPPAVGIGGEVAVDVYLDADEEINALSGSITFPSENISFVEVHDGGSVVTLWIEQPHYADGAVSFSGLIPGGYQGDNALLFRIIVSGVTEGISIFNSDDIMLLANDGEGSQVTVHTEMVTLLVDDEDATTTERVADIVSPEAFEIRVEHDESLFEGDWFAVFATQDKGAGISYYELQERRTNSIDESEWVRVTSPHELSDQGLHSYIFIKAVDRAGNVRIATLAPQRGGLLLLFLFYGIVAVAIFYSVKYFRVRRKNKHEYTSLQ